MDLSGKVAWITGGARMGLSVAQALSHAGCRIVLTYRSSRKATMETVDVLMKRGVEASAFQCDLSKLSDTEKASRNIYKQFGGLDILVNLASMYGKGAWYEHMLVNARGAYDLTMSVLPWMKKSETGRIIHIADWTSTSGRPRYREFGGYYASKATIQAVVEAMALEHAPKVLINAIAPGPMLPPRGMSTKEYAEVVKATPLARWGGAEEIAKAVRFLCETDFVTGETIRVDGGRHLS